MSIKSKRGFILRHYFSLLATTVCLSAASLAAYGEPADETRTSTSRHVLDGGRETPQLTASSDEEYEAIVTTGDRGKSETRSGNSKPGSGSVGMQASGYDFWIYDVDVQIFNDDDFDGYYHGIDVLFDADTNFGVADVYAVLYLSLEGGPWNEYAVTEDFTIFGASGDDEYVLISELMSGYPTGNYDLLIEVFDPYDGTFLASFGPEDSSAMSFIPLEDFNRDAPIREVHVTVSEGGGGAADAWLLCLMLLAMLLGAVRKIWNHRNDEVLRIDQPESCWQDTRKRGVGSG